MTDVKLCKSATDLQCAVHWDTYSEAVRQIARNGQHWQRMYQPFELAIKWRVYARAVFETVKTSGRFQVELTGSLAATGVTTDTLCPHPQICRKPNAKRRAVYL